MSTTTKPSEPAQHTAGAAAPAAEDPILGSAVDAALHDARARMTGPGEPNMVLGAVQAELAEGDGGAVATLPGPSIDDLDASLAQAAAEATARLLEEADGPLPPVEPGPQPQPEAAAARPAPADAKVTDAASTVAPPDAAAAAPEPALAEPAAESPDPAAPADEPAVPIPLSVRVRRAAASVLDPLAERAERLPLGVRHTIGWAAVFTLLNAAAVWAVVLWAPARGSAAGHERAAGAETTPASHNPAGGGH